MTSKEEIMERFGIKPDELAGWFQDLLKEGGDVMGDNPFEENKEDRYKVYDLETNKVYYFNTIISMVEQLGIQRPVLRKGIDKKEVIYKRYRIIDRKNV